MKARLLVICFAVLLAGCAKPNVNVHMDGKPMPNSSFVSKSSTTQMRAEAVVGWYYPKKDSEYDKEYLEPEYLEVGETYKDIPKKAECVKGHVLIVNPMNVAYTVRVITKIKLPDRDWPIVQNEIIYTGKSHREVFDIKSNIQKQNPLVSIRLVVDRGITEPGVLSFKDMSYDPRDSIFDIPLITYKIAG